MYRTCFLQQNFFSLSLDWCLQSHIIQNFLKYCFTRRMLPFFSFSVVNYLQLCSFRPMHTQFRSILHDLKSFDYVKKQFYCLHRIVVGLQFKLPTRQNKEKEKWDIFLDSHRWNFQNCVPKQSFNINGFQKCTELVFYTKISSLFL